MPVEPCGVDPEEVDNPGADPEERRNTKTLRESRRIVHRDAAELGHPSGRRPRGRVQTRSLDTQVVADREDGFQHVGNPDRTRQGTASR